MKINKSKLYIALIISFVALLPMFLFSFATQQTEPWTPNQLMEPVDLASTIDGPQSSQHFVISVGPGAVIKGSHEIGPTVPEYSSRIYIVE